MAELEVLKENIEYEQMLGEGSCDTVVRGEYLIPDTHPDVEEILMLDVKPTINEREILQDRVYVEGNLEYNVLYLAREDEGMGIYSVTYNDKFSNYIEIQGAEGRLSGDIDYAIEHMNCNIINERKLEVEGIIKFRGEVYKNYSVDIMKDIDTSNNVQMLKKPTTVDKMVGITEEELAGNSTVKISMDKPQIGKVLKCNVYLHKNEVTLEENKINMSTFAKVQILYRGADSKEVMLIEEDIYIPKTIAKENINSDMKCLYDMKLKNTDINIKQDDLGENRIIDIEIKVDVDIKLMTKEQYDVIEDAYSPKNVIELSKEKYDLNVFHGMNDVDIIVKDNIDIPKDDPMPIQTLMSKGEISITDKKVVEGKVIIEGIVNIHVIYKTKDEVKPLYHISEELPFTATVDIPGTKINMNCQCKAYLESLDTAIEADTIAVKAVIHLWSKTSYNEIKEFLIGLNKLEEDPPGKKASITIYVVQEGDSLWKIAKKYYTTIEELLKINEIRDPDNLKMGDKIIVPGRARI